MITWITPTVDGREESYERSIAPIRDRPDIELLTYRNLPTCGAAWVQGAREAQGDHIYFSADDVEPWPGFIEAMIEATDRKLHPAALVLLPDGSKQSCGGAGGDVCRGNCPDWQLVEWSPTPFIRREWWPLLDKHAGQLASLQYSSDCLVSAVLAVNGIPSVMRRQAVLTHYNETPGRLGTAGLDGGRFHEYRVAHGL